MDINQHELYEYARLRLKQKKRLYFHFVLFVLGSIFFIASNKLMNILPETNWAVWAIIIWLFIFILHFIRVFVTDSFMNKKWEREQIDKLMAKQERRIEQLQKDLDQQS
ncbi:2TM domain-containing protein [Flavobacterium luminosum]|uniref:2TM domain-containing protein n=1 Tax=Flavobacterium luminosum TaxID=2949086 RepID=A0ABT0TPD0_9FLAO|nr:2TM domain-containing protein [Flavobacterium sp. HXWNR70]MCL9809347.1 2TM domain-containing protein [Flavobacterium sp. HXWNR70]